eukprot:maker-scaffold124_size330879-snap-gene-1.30 protein:Tk01491 transcript:maker-scaffold124_size330879-snap-gene-1.30-mRNA-1 annotation:"kelch-like protein 38"
MAVIPLPPLVVVVVLPSRVGSNMAPVWGDFVPLRKLTELSDEELVEQLRSEIASNLNLDGPRVEVDLDDLHSVECNGQTLAEYIPFYRSLFHFKQSQEGVNPTRVDLNLSSLGLELAHGAILIRYIHTLASTQGNYAYANQGLKSELTMKNVVSILIGAHYLELAHCVRACENFVYDHTNLETLIHSYNIAVLYGFDGLTKPCARMLSLNMPYVTNTGDLEYPTLKNFLGLQMCSWSENAMFQFLLAWLALNKRQLDPDQLQELADLIDARQLSRRNTRRYSRIFKRTTSLMHRIPGFLILTSASGFPCLSRNINPWQKEDELADSLNIFSAKGHIMKTILRPPKDVNVGFLAISPTNEILLLSQRPGRCPGICSSHASRCAEQSLWHYRIHHGTWKRVRSVPAEFFGEPLSMAFSGFYVALLGSGVGSSRGTMAYAYQFNLRVPRIPVGVEALKCQSDAKIGLVQNRVYVFVKDTLYARKTKGWTRYTIFGQSSSNTITTSPIQASDHFLILGSKVSSINHWQSYRLAVFNTMTNTVQNIDMEAVLRPFPTRRVIAFYKHNKDLYIVLYGVIVKYPLRKYAPNVKEGSLELIPMIGSFRDTFFNNSHVVSSDLMDFLLYVKMN